MKSPYLKHLHAFSILFIVFNSFFTVYVNAKPVNQSLILIGGALKTCSSFSQQNCQSHTKIEKLNAKTTSQYKINTAVIEKIKQFWPDENGKLKNKTLRILSSFSHLKNKKIEKSVLVDAWRKSNKKNLNSLTDQQYYFVLDMLEVQVINKNGNRLKEAVLTSNNKIEASTEILSGIVKRLKTISQRPKIIVTTASSRDPYESADFYEGLFANQGVEVEWLPLTPALAFAIDNNQCNNLPKLRRDLSGSVNRDAVYPDRTFAEKKLCKSGKQALIKKLRSADAIMFNGGDQTLTKSIFYRKDNTEYLWTKTIREIAILIGTSAGTAVQGGGMNQYGNIAMITNGSSKQALIQGAISSIRPSEDCEKNNSCSENVPSKTLTYDEQGGLASFDLGILDTHFSERNRSLRLFTLVAHTNQKYGFGIDETTALVVDTYDGQKQLSVVGQSGVVVISPISKNEFNYSYWPSGSQISFDGNKFSLSSQHEVKAKAHAKVKMPLIENVLSSEKMKKLTQLMCLTDQTSANAYDKDQDLDLKLTYSKTATTQFYVMTKTKQTCGIENLKVSIDRNVI